MEFTQPMAWLLAKTALMSADRTIKTVAPKEQRFSHHPAERIGRLSFHPPTHSMLLTSLLMSLIPRMVVVDQKACYELSSCWAEGLAHSRWFQLVAPQLKVW